MGTGTDQTNPVTYTRPGVWQASSPGVAGIDQVHNFASPAREPLLPASNPPGVDGAMGGPSAVADTKAPAQNSRRWWQKRNSSEFQLDVNANGPEAYNTTVPQPQADALGWGPRSANPWVKPVANPRWTGNEGPQNVEYSHVPASGNFRARRFEDHGGATYAFTPSLRPSPAALGDGRGFARFRPTQRVSPVPLDQQIVSEDQQSRSGPVLSSGGTLSQRWW